ncbi:MAG TPA: sulfur carrier protein ThiS [Candidatus Wallbacteria bacterium]|nr:sulfur carrier protein ThiS [Candidatus Wallbacteria bacterium]
MIIVNGQAVEWHKDFSVSELLRTCNYSFPLIIVKINGKHIEKHAYQNQMVADGSNVEVIHLMSGG